MSPTCIRSRKRLGLTVVLSTSVGEPSTQMTLNTFHFAGLSRLALSLRSYSVCPTSQATELPTSLLESRDCVRSS